VAGWIVVVRHRSIAAWEARFAVFLDGRRVAKLGRDAMQDFPVEAGIHRVRVRQWGYPSKTLTVSVADGETVIVRTRTRFWANFLTSMSGTLIGGRAFWLFSQGLTAANVAICGIGVVGIVVLVGSRVVISLRADPAPAPGPVPANPGISPLSV
jgi:hypothetical protein